MWRVFTEISSSLKALNYIKYKWKISNNFSTFIAKFQLDSDTHIVCKLEKQLFFDFFDKPLLLIRSYMNSLHWFQIIFSTSYEGLAGHLSTVGFHPLQRLLQVAELRERNE